VHTIVVLHATHKIVVLYFCFAEHIGSDPDSSGDNARLLMPKCLGYLVEMLFHVQSVLEKYIGRLWILFCVRRGEQRS
jgi:hypothetical protein